MSIQYLDQKNKLQVKSEVNAALVSNLIPNSWYHSILTAGNKPDCVGIAILSELFFVYRATGASKFETSYSKLQNKFNFSKEQLKDALQRLGKNDLIIRSQEVVNDNVSGCQKLSFFLILNITKLTEVTTNSFSNKISSKIKRNNPLLGEEFSSQAVNNYYRSEEISSYIYRYKEKSDLDKNILCFNEKKEELQKIQKADNFICGDETYNNISQIKNVHDVSNKFILKERKTLSAFYPLTEEDAMVLRAKLSKNFTLEHINDLVLRLSLKRPDNGFFNKELFFNYMSKVLEHEKSFNHERNFQSLRKSTIHKEIRRNTESEISGKTKILDEDRVYAESILENTIWDCLRKSLVMKFNKYVDINWLSKLKVSNDENSKKLEIRAQSSFVYQWIKANYLSSIESFCSKQGYKIEGFS